MLTLLSLRNIFNQIAYMSWTLSFFFSFFLFFHYFFFELIVSFLLDLQMATIPVETFHVPVDYATSIGFEPLPFSVLMGMCMGES